MTKLLALAAGLFLSALLIAPVNADRQSFSGEQQVQQNETAGKKAMETMREREQKKREVKKRAAAERQKALSENSETQDRQTVK